MIPVVDIRFFLLNELQFLLRVIDKCAELTLFCLTQGVAEELVDLTLYVSGGILQNVLECFVFSVNVRKEVLCSLWKVQYRL